MLCTAYRARFVLLALALTTSLGLLVGQRQATPASSGQSQIQTPAVETREAITPEDIFAFSRYRRTFTAVEGPRTGQQVTVTQQRAQGGPANWILTIEGLNRMYMTLDQDGDLVLTRMDQLNENKAVTYQPAVVLLPARLEAGTAVSQSGLAVVYDLETGEETRRGTYTHDIDRVTRSQLQIPAGTMVGYLLEYDHSVDVPMATLSLRLDMAFVPDVGLIYVRQKSTVEKLGMFGETTIRSLALEEQVQRQ